MGTTQAAESVETTTTQQTQQPLHRAAAVSNVAATPVSNASVEAHLAAVDALAGMLAMPSDQRAALVDGLKARADANLGRDPRISLLFANLIIGIGEMTEDGRTTALGTMARGDALRFQGRFRLAWETLAQAGALYLEAGDEIGWARTRIGRLLASVELDDSDIDMAYADALRAETILLQHAHFERLVHLYLNLGAFHVMRTEPELALTFYQRALGYLEYIDDKIRVRLWHSLGHTWQLLGHFGEAEHYLLQALQVVERLDQPQSMTQVRLNLAILYMEQGKYRRALTLLHMVKEDPLPFHVAFAHSNLGACYRMLGNHRDAQAWNALAVQDFRRLNATNQIGRALSYLADAEYGLGNFAAAKTALDEAEQIYRSRQEIMHLMAAQVRRGLIALRQQDKAALQQAIGAIGAVAPRNLYFAANSALLAGEAALLVTDSCDLPDVNAACQAGKTLLRLARQAGMPTLRYQAHVLLGRTREAEARPAAALRHYRVAAGVVERLQRDMQITFRPGFLEDRGGALRGIVRLHLEANRPAEALMALERLKSQVLFGYLLNGHGLRWPADHPEVGPLVERLDSLRVRYRWLLQRHDQPGDPQKHAADLASEPAAVQIDLRERAERQALERDIRHITERLYLLADSDRAVAAEVPDLARIMASIPTGSALIEYFIDAPHVWAFVLDSTGELRAQMLPATIDEVLAAVRQMRLHINRALAVGPDSFAIARHRERADSVFGQLYAALLAPLIGAAIPDTLARVIVVPFGGLHGLPFHLLHDGQSYLSDRCEVVICPTAGLLAHHREQSPQHARGALMLACTDADKPLDTHLEAEALTALFGAEHCAVHVGEAATRSRLNTSPGEVLHIAAHGKHNLEQPQLSELALADGAIYADDLVQHDLGYELVTLSACETGLCRASGGDELIGLGRGFLYGGADALLTSLWKVDDRLTGLFMQAFYGALGSGLGKAAALCAAQRVLRADRPALHPAFWGAFQLMGSAAPLSRFVAQSEFVR